MNQEIILLMILHNLNEYKKGEAIIIEDLKEKLPIHKKLIKNYLGLIDFIQNECPKIHYNEKTKRYELIEYNPLISLLDKQEKLILFLFILKAINEQSSLRLDEILDSDLFELKEIKQSPYINYTFEFNNLTSKEELKVWLSRRGGIKAQGLFSKLFDLMQDRLENQNNR